MCTMSLDIDWDIDQYKEGQESDDLWHLRRIFMKRWKWSYPEEKVVYLARAFANIALTGSTYPVEVMQEVAWMSKDLRQENSNSDHSTFLKTGMDLDGASGTHPQNYTHLEQNTSASGNTTDYSLEEDTSEQSRVCILDALEPISTNKTLLLMKALQQHFNNYTSDGVIRFPIFEIKCGCTIITCANKCSKNWLEKNLPTFQPWAGAQLTIVDYRSENKIQHAANSVALPSQILALTLPCPPAVASSVALNHTSKASLAVTTIFNNGVNPGTDMPLTTSISGKEQTLEGSRAASSIALPISSPLDTLSLNSALVQAVQRQDRDYTSGLFTELSALRDTKLQPPTDPATAPAKKKKEQTQADKAEAVLNQQKDASQQSPSTALSILVGDERVQVKVEPSTSTNDVTVRRHRTTPRGKRAGKLVAAHRAKRSQLNDTGDGKRVNAGSKTIYAPAAAFKANRLCVAVMTEPFYELSSEQAARIRIAMETKLENDFTSPTTAAEMSMVVFRGKAHHSDGVLKIWCANEHTLFWVRSVVESLETPISGTKLVVRPQAETQDRKLCSLFIPAPDWDIDRVLTLLAAQNSTLDTKTWKLVKSVQQRERGTPGVLLILRVPTMDIEKLNSNQRRMRWLMGSIYIWVLEEKSIAGASNIANITS